MAAAFGARKTRWSSGSVPEFGVSCGNMVRCANIVG